MSGVYLPYTSHDLKCILVHIPKTGGTSLRKLLSLSDAEQPFDTMAHPTWRRWKELDAEAWRNYFKFCVVRDPVDRFMSAYRFAVATSSYYHDSGWEHPDRMLVRSYSNVGFFVDHIFNCGSFEAAGLSHCSWNPQYEYVVNSDGKKVVDKCIRFENFEQDVTKLCFKLGVPELSKNIPHLNSTDVKREVVSRVCELRLRMLYAEDCNTFDY